MARLSLLPWLLPFCAVAGERPLVLVFESEAYLKGLEQGAGGSGVDFLLCSPLSACDEIAESTRTRVIAVVGQPHDVAKLKDLPNLRLLQSTHYMYPSLADIPAHVTVAVYHIDYQHDYGAEPIAEWTVAAMFEWNYRLSRQSRLFADCAFADDAPRDCPATSTITEHPTLMGATLGVLGYGTIGKALAGRAGGLGMRVVATKRHVPEGPPPAPLAWLSSDNDRLLRESDFVAVTVTGKTVDLINKTALALMKPNAVLIPISAPPVDYDALFDVLERRSIGGAVLDVWPQGCWHYPNMTCGSPFGPSAWPYSQRKLASLNNTIVLPGSSMRDRKFWRNSAAFASGNLKALLEGSSLAGVVRNGTLSRSFSI